MYQKKGVKLLKGEYLRLKIKKLEVIKLYNMYDYNIEFNDDITFLHGKNGCGKTTILNIITYIITGRIYKLFSYDFEKIILTYKKDKENELICFSKIENNIKISFKDQEIDIDKISKIEEDELEGSNRLLRYSANSIELHYFNKYPILKVIKDLFDFVYIPLNRKNLEFK